MMRVALLAGVATLSSCAWSNQDNRPVWNAFERHLVPDGDGWFVATLPLTVPLGFASIVVDTVVAHPIQVLDDAVLDAGELWNEDDLEFEQAYYTEMAWLPFRAVFTPLAFAGSFAGRVLFDIPPHRERLSDEERVALAEQRERERLQQRRARFLQWLADPRGGSRPTVPDRWHESLAGPMQRALAADAAGRRALHVGMLDADCVVFGGYRAEEGLRDPDPVVRYTCIEHWPLHRGRPDGALVEALRQDPVESVRLLAQRRFGAR